MKEMGNLLDEIYVFDDIIPKDIQTRLAATVKKELWTYSWKTAWEDNFFAWGRSVANPLRGGLNAEEKLMHDQHQIEAAACWNIFQQSFLRGHSLLRSFVIGFHHGCEGYVHGDNNDPEDNGKMGNGLTLANYRSTIIFAFDEWEAQWGGEMILYNREMTDIICAVQPKPFRVLSFPGLLPHKPNGPIRESDRYLPLLSFRSKQILRT